MPQSLTQNLRNEHIKKKVKKREEKFCLVIKKGCIFAAAKNGNVCGNKF